MQKVGRDQASCEGSEGAQACSLGREPQVERHPTPKAPKGRRQTNISRKTAVTPSGLRIC
jgi:hypothetical protein